MEIRSILKFPLVYQTYQRIVGGIHMRERCIEVLAPEAGHRVLDVGCGPAYYLKDLPQVDYHGFDTDEVYINHAKKRFADRGQFYCEPFSLAAAERLGSFDRILLMGLLHHLDDQECHHLLELLANSLRPNGILVALETIVHDDQNRLERALALGDRGQYVRRPEAFVALAKPYFGQVEGSLRDARWIPSIFWVMKLEQPLRGQAALGSSQSSPSGP